MCRSDLSHGVSRPLDLDAEGQAYVLIRFASDDDVNPRNPTFILHNFTESEGKQKKKTYCLEFELPVCRPK